MKTKISLFVGAVVMVLILSLGTAARAQMYGSQKPANANAGGSGAPAAKESSAKPGTKMADGTIVATPITAEDAQKKYPMPNGKPYPTGDRPTSHFPGHILSPYPPRQEYLCNSIPHGGLVLDIKTNKVFVRP